MAKPKLHELLAVKPNKLQQAAKIIADFIANVEKKIHRFSQKKILFTPYEEGKLPQEEVQSVLELTIPSELKFLQAPISAAIDVNLHIAVANMSAKADIVIDGGTVIAKDVPATALLELEKTVTQIRDLYSRIPVLDSAKGFVKDPTIPDGYIAREVNKERTRKTKEVIVLAVATKEHPQQQVLVDIDKPSGAVKEMEWSTLITPTQKSELLGRADILLRAVKAARSRANDIEVDTSLKLGKPLFDYLSAA